jgi:hypothetical protein
MEGLDDAPTCKVLNHFGGVGYNPQDKMDLTKVS